MSVGQLSNTQLELLKAFSHPLSNEDLMELKDLLSKFFAQKAIKNANQVWDEKGWTNDTMDDFLKQKLRSKKKN